MKIERIKGSAALAELDYSGDGVVGEDNYFLRFTDEHFTLYFKEESIPSGDVVWVVMKNSDFTEGRGPMRVHRIFYYLYEAVDFVLSQDGIYGSKQSIRNYCGISVSGKPFVISSFNGFEINPHQVI